MNNRSNAPRKSQKRTSTEREFTPKNNSQRRFSTEKSFSKKEKTFDKPFEKSSFGKDKPDFKKDKPFFKKKNTTEKILQPAENKDIRLNRYIANAGICSRREADKFITAGSVLINGKPVTELGYRVKPTDEVKFDGKTISAEKKQYILLNKPKGFITTTQDEKGRKTVMELVANATDANIKPVGRLDRLTTGLLLFTNDGELTKKLTHPSHGVRKIYHVVLDRKLNLVDFHKIQDGLTLEDGFIQVDEISFVENAPKNELGIKIHSGRNRIVRRIFEHLGYQVEKLDRVSFAGLTKKDLPRGHWRHLTPQEVINLKNIK